MSKFIKNLFTFSIFMLIAYPAFIIVWAEFMPYSFNRNLNYPIGSNGHMFSRIKEVSQFRNIDILFLGSSHSYRGFDPRIFAEHNIRSFNLGSSFQTPMQTEILLKRYLNRLNPKLIIFEVYPEIFTTDGVESSLDLIANDKVDLYALDMAFDINHIKTYNALIYSVYRSLFNLNSDYREERKKGHDLYVKAGFVERQPGKSDVAEISTPREWNFREDQKLAFQRILSDFKSRGIPYILVQAPITKDLYLSYKNNREVDDYFRSSGPYYNFNEVSQLPSHYFYDLHHLNQQGVERFNRSLLSILEKNRMIPM